MKERSAILDLMEKLQELDVDEPAKGKFRHLLEGVFGLGIKPDERVEYAVQLLTLKVSRATIKDRLMARFDVSRRHAYRIIEVALQRK